jgi:hypothetical protein
LSAPQPQPRLVLFLSDVEGNLTAVRQSLKRVCQEAGISVPEVKWVEQAEGLTDAGWRVVEVEPLTGGRKHPAPDLAEHLDAMTQALGQDFRDRVLGLFTDRNTSYARVCASGPSRPTKALEGEYIDVLRQAAKWLDVDATALARLVGGTQRNVLAAAVDFGNELSRMPPPVETTGPAEPDEDDRFVDAKLSEARALMERYLSSTRK